MLATDTAEIVARLHLSGLLSVRDGAAIAVWHADIGHLDKATAVAACHWLEQNRSSDAYGPTKPADLLTAVARIKRDRIDAVLRGAPTPAPPAELDHDPAAGVAWQQAWIAAAGDGATHDQATTHADTALAVARQPEQLRNRPTAAIAAQLGDALRMPGTRDHANA